MKTLFDKLWDNTDDIDQQIASRVLDGEYTFQRRPGTTTFW